MGIRLQCQSDIEIITPAVMPLLQGHITKQQNEMAVIMWNGGMLVQRICEPTQPKVEALVSISGKKIGIYMLLILLHEVLLIASKMLSSSLTSWNISPCVS